jgi:hypothetical protein
MAVLVTSLPATADDFMAGPGSYDDSLTPQSSWADILKTPGVRVDFPMLSFGNRYVPLPEVCAENGALRIADPTLDNGVRIGLAPGPRTGGLTGYAIARSDPFSVGPAALTDEAKPPAAPQVRTGPVGYPVTVYKNTWGVTTSHVPLFQKVWEVPACRTA